MVQPLSREDDDAPSDLPPLTREARDEENFEPGDDSDLGLGEERDDKLDLDDATGDVVVDGYADLVEESGSWLDDGAEPASIDVDASDDGEDDDDGEGGGTEPASDTHTDDWEDDFGFDERGGEAGDSGEEGFGDDGLLAGLDLDKLPPLDAPLANDDETTIENDPLTADSIAELALGASEAALLDLGAGLTCVQLDPALVRLEQVQHGGSPLRGLSAAGRAGVALEGRTLLVADAGANVAEARFVSDEPVLVLAANGAEPALIVFATPAGVSCSRDAGRSFGAQAPLPNAPGPVSAIAFGRGSAATRVFAATASGPLYASDDGCASFRCVLPEARVLRVAADGRGGLIVLGRGERGTASALRSTDGGNSFAPLALPVNEPERVQDLQIAGDVVLCCRRAPLPQLLLWSAREQNWTEVAGAQPPALLIDEAGTVRLYFCAGTRLLRLAAFGESLPELVAELPAEAGAPLQLAGSHRNGMTHLQLGTERAWYRVGVAREDGTR